MTEADGVAKATTNETWLTRHEADLNGRLQDSRVSFVAEIATDPAALERSRHEYGFLAVQMARQNIDRTRLATWYPALTLVLLVDSAARCESLDDFWSQYSSDLGCPVDAELRDVLKSVTPDLLRNFGLLDITELDADFSAILAGQAAIPTLHTTELVELAERYLEMGPITDEYHFAQWLAELDATGRPESDRTVQRFARYGGRLASDVLDGVVDLVTGSSAAPTGDPASGRGAGMPAALRRSLQDLLTRGRQSSAPEAAPRRPTPALPAVARAHGQPIGRHRTPAVAAAPSRHMAPVPAGPAVPTPRPVPAGQAVPATPQVVPTARPVPAGQVVPTARPVPATAQPVPATAQAVPTTPVERPGQIDYPTEIAPPTDPFRAADAPPTVLLNVPVPDGMVDPWNPLDATNTFTGGFPAIVGPRREVGSEPTAL